MRSHHCAIGTPPCCPDSRSPASPSLPARLPSISPRDVPHFSFLQSRPLRFSPSRIFLPPPPPHTRTIPLLPPLTFPRLTHACFCRPHPLDHEPSTPHNTRKKGAKRATRRTGPTFSPVCPPPSFLLFLFFVGSPSPPLSPSSRGSSFSVFVVVLRPNSTLAATPSSPHFSCSSASLSALRVCEPLLVLAPLPPFSTNTRLRDTLQFCHTLSLRVRFVLFCFLSAPHPRGKKGSSLTWPFFSLRASASFASRALHVLPFVSFSFFLRRSRSLLAFVCVCGVSIGLAAGGFFFFPVCLARLSVQFLFFPLPSLCLCGRPCLSACWLTVLCCARFFPFLSRCLLCVCVCRLSCPRPPLRWVPIVQERPFRSPSFSPPFFSLLVGLCDCLVHTTDPPSPHRRSPIHSSLRLHRLLPPFHPHRR